MTVPVQPLPRRVVAGTGSPNSAATSPRTRPAMASARARSSASLRGGGTCPYSPICFETSCCKVPAARDRAYCIHTGGIRARDDLQGACAGAVPAWSAYRRTGSRRHAQRARSTPRRDLRSHAPRSPSRTTAAQRPQWRASAAQSGRGRRSPFPARTRSHVPGPRVVSPPISSTPHGVAHDGGGNRKTFDPIGIACIESQAEGRPVRRYCVCGESDEGSAEHVAGGPRRRRHPRRTAPLPSHG